MEWVFVIAKVTVLHFILGVFHFILGVLQPKMGQRGLQDGQGSLHPGGQWGDIGPRDQECGQVKQIQKHFVTVTETDQYGDYSTI